MIVCVLKSVLPLFKSPHQGNILLLCNSVYQLNMDKNSWIKSFCGGICANISSFYSGKNIWSLWSACLLLQGDTLEWLTHKREQVAAFLDNNRALWQKKEYFTLAFGKMEQKNYSTDWLEMKTQTCCTYYLWLHWAQESGHFHQLLSKTITNWTVKRVKVS